MTSSPAPAPSPTGMGRGLLFLFVALHVINHIDRNLIASFGPQIMADLHLSRSQFALIAGLAFSGVYAFTALGAGLLADRIGRVRVLTGGLMTWSLFTALASLTTSFLTLLAVRPVVAAGEATLVPTATNIILTRTPDRSKATAVGIFFMGIPLGLGASYLIAGTVGPVLGWRHTFLLMGTLGLLACLLVMRIKDQSGTAKGSVAAPTMRSQINGLWGQLKTNPRLRYSSIAIVVIHAHMSTSPFTQLWLQQDKAMAPAKAASLYGGLFMVFGMIGSAGAGWLCDWLHRRWAIDRAKSVAGFVLVLAPLIMVYRLAPGGSPLMILGMIASIFFFTMAYGPCMAIIEQELPPHLKASMTGLNILVLNLLMMGGLSYGVGLASEAMAKASLSHSWTYPIMAADLIGITAGLFLWLASRTPAHNGQFTAPQPA